MRSGIGRVGKRVLRRALRGSVYLSLLSKLLVPVGYMPAAWAEGVPISLCGAGLPPGFASARHAARATAAVPHGHEEAAGTHAPGHHAGHGTDHGPSGGSAHGGHEHGEDAAEHGPWERCSLGGLASLAALAAEWPGAAFPAASGERAATQNAPLLERTVAVVRSRGPPSASV